MFKDGSRIRGGHAYRQHQSFKDFIRCRDNYTCQHCGAPGLVVHHIIPWAVSHETIPEGVQVLCRPCNLALRRQRYDAALPYDQWIAMIERDLAVLEGG